MFRLSLEPALNTFGRAEMLYTTPVSRFCMYDTGVVNKRHMYDTAARSRHTSQLGEGLAGVC